MKKIITKIITVILVVSIISSISMPTTAIEIEPIDTVETNLSVELYANQIIFEMIEVSELSVSQLYISQRYSVHNSNQALFFVFDNTICIGYLIVNCDNNPLSSSFVPKQLPIISDLFSNNSPIAFISDNDVIFAVTQNNVVFDFTLEQLIPFDNTSNLSLPASNTLSAITLEAVTQSTTDNSAEINRSIPYSIQLDIPYVEYDFTPNGVSLCWASAICSIAAYRLNDSTPMTALQLYNALLAEYPEDGTPYGCDIHIMNAFMYFGFYDFNYYDCGLTPDKVYNALNANRPIFVGMYTSDYSKGHAVALCGIQRTYTSNLYYTVMDHQLQKIVCHQPNNSFSAVSDSITVTIRTTTYTRWTGAIW